MSNIGVVVVLYAFYFESSPEVAFLIKPSLVLRFAEVAQAEGGVCGRLGATSCSLTQIV